MLKLLALYLDTNAILFLHEGLKAFDKHCNQPVKIFTTLVSKTFFFLNTNVFYISSFGEMEEKIYNLMEILKNIVF